MQELKPTDTSAANPVAKPAVELVTVAKQYRFAGREKWETQPKMFGMDAVEERTLVTRENAEEHTAAAVAEKQEEIERLSTIISSSINNIAGAELDDLQTQLAAANADAVGYKSTIDHLTQRSETAEAENAKLWEALKPFSFSNTRYDFDLFDDETKIYLRLPNPKKPRFAPETWVYMSHVRAARSLLKKGTVE